MLNNNVMTASKESSFCGEVTLKSCQNGSFSVTGNRIPQKFFVTQGCGESDIAIHAGSYHLALKSAGIEMCNIITYSSILPKIATEIERSEAGELVHGCVLESIMAVGSAGKGQRVSAGIIFGWLQNRKTGERYGGLVCEHSGDYSGDEVKGVLECSLDELYLNGYSDDYELSGSRCIVESIVPEKKFGTALVSLCFTSYLYPVILRSTVL